MDHITLRLPAALKSRVEQHAKKTGISLSLYLRQILEGSLEPPAVDHTDTLAQLTASMIETRCLVQFLVHASPEFSHEDKTKLLALAKEKATNSRTSIDRG